MAESADVPVAEAVVDTRSPALRWWVGPASLAGRSELHNRAWRHLGATEGTRDELLADARKLRAAGDILRAPAPVLGDELMLDHAAGWTMGPAVSLLRNNERTRMLPSSSCQQQMKRDFWERPWSGTCSPDDIAKEQKAKKKESNIPLAVAGLLRKPPAWWGK